MTTAIVLVEHGYQELGFWYPVLRLRELGIDVSVAGPAADETYVSTLGYPVIPDVDVVTAARQRPDLLITPGGEAGERLKTSAQTADLVRASAKVVESPAPDDLPGLFPGLGFSSDEHLRGRRILVLAESQYQELELWYPVLRFREAGADVVVASPSRGALYASKIGYPVRSDVSVADVDPTDVDALVIPGGFAPEGMRRSQPLLDLVRKTWENGTIVAAICHAGWSWSRPASPAAAGSPACRSSGTM